MGAVDWAQKAFEIAQKLNNADLLVALAQLKSDFADKVTEIASLKERIGILEAQLAATSQLHLDDGVYWRGKRPEGDLSAQPLCPACWDDKRKQIHMAIHRDKYHADYFECPICHHMVDDPKGTPTLSLTGRIRPDTEW